MATGNLMLNADDLAGIEEQVVQSLDTTVVVMARTETVDDMGGRTVTYVESVSVPGRIVRSSVSYQQSSDRIVTTTTTRVVMPKTTIVSMGDKLVVDGIDWNVISAPVVGMVTMYVDVNLMRA